MKNILLVIILLLTAESVLACEGTDNEWARTLNSDKHTVKGPFSIEELEQKHMVEIRETKEKLPFGYVNEKWKKLKSLFKSGDKFYFVHYEDGSFFVEQYVLVREKCIIGALWVKIS